jgi:hypothetical protein
MKILLFLGFFCYSLFCLAQNGKVQGLIRNGISSEASPYVSIQIGSVLGNGFFGETISDSLGRFDFYNLPSGTYDLNFGFVGFQPYKFSNVKVSNDSVTFIEIKFPCPNGTKLSEKICSFGHTDEIIPIGYGYPTEKTMKKAQAGKIYLGGCIITDCSPAWYCKKHKITF